MPFAGKHRAISRVVIFFLAVSVLWTGLAVYLVTRFPVSNLLPTLVILLFLYGLTWWFYRRG